MAKPKKSKRPRVKTGEDFLDSISEIEIRLESGQRARFRLAAEFQVPSDPEEVRNVVQRAAERLSFWAYQTARALREVRKLRRRVAQVEAEYDLRYRKTIREMTDEDYTERCIRSHVDRDPQVIEARARLDAASYQHDVLCGVRDSVEQRCFILRKLVDPKTTYVT